MAEKEKKPLADIALRHQLTKPIQAHGEEIKEIEFREPTARDIDKCGMPVFIEYSPNKAVYRVEASSMIAMMSELAGVPPSSIHAISAKDYATIAQKLSNFFIPD